jgi:hypothetical protein
MVPVPFRVARKLHTLDVDLGTHGWGSAESPKFSPHGGAVVLISTTGPEAMWKTMSNCPQSQSSK